MAWQATKGAVQALWGRGWVRRVSYFVVAGATAVTLAPWLASRPGVLRLVEARLDALVQDETGLHLRIGRMELHPMLGSVVFHDIRLGQDLLTIERAEIQADLTSLLGPNHRVHWVRIEHPHLRLTEAGLAELRLKSRPPRTTPLPRFQLDLFSLTGAEIMVPQPLRGIPALSYQFELKATGPRPNLLRFDLVGPQLAVDAPGGWQKGRLDLNGEVSEPALGIQEAYLRLGESQLRLSGRFEPGTAQVPARLEARLTGLLDLAQASRWGSKAPPALSGSVDLGGTLQGSLAKPTWTLTIDGQALKPAGGSLAPGDLEFKAAGGMEAARLDQLRWTSPQGTLAATGTWSQQSSAQVALEGSNLDLEALGRALRLPELRGTYGSLQAHFEGPGAWPEAGRLDRWQASLKVALTQQGRAAGELVAALDHGRATLEQLTLDLESLKAEASGSVLMGPRRLLQMEGEGRAEVRVSQVARALSAWKVTDLDMEGQAKAHARLRWEPAKGLALEGAVEVERPRWHGAQADSIQGKVQILDSNLWVRNIEVRKGAGQGGGELWLTWAKLAPGQDQMDMCYTAHRLPVAEGLKAADLGALPLTGTASGWARLWGPYDRIRLTGAAQVEAGEAYGIAIPAASSDFSLDLGDLRLKLQDVRVAERPELLGQGELPPEGPLALTGKADMDFQNSRWWVELSGRMDSQLLALPGPRLQSQVTARLLGPITTPFGALDLPEGRIELSRGRLFFGDRSVEGLTGSLELERGNLLGRVAMEGMARPLLDFRVRQDGPDLQGDLALSISRENAHSDSIARSITEDLLEDLSLEARIAGRWQGGRKLTWTGSLDQLSARFNAFDLHQTRPSALRGDAFSAGVDIALEGGARGPDAQLTAQAARMQVAGTIPFLASAPMAIQTRGEANLAHLKAILDRVMEVDEYSLLSELRVQGLSRFDILAHGTYAEPLLDGNASLEKAQLHLPRYQGVEDLQAEVVLKDRTLSILAAKPLRGTLAHGDLTASGVLAWQPGGIDTYALKASLAHFQLRDVPDGLDLQGSLQATLEGGEEGGLLKGKLRADHLGYQTEVKLSDLILRSALGDSGGLSGLDLDDPLNRIRLDLDLDLRTPWSFDTNLLKLEGRTEGPFQVLGTLAHPVPRGTMVFQPGGRITNIFPAGDMVVDRGTLAFSESRPMDPVINLQGSLSSIPGYTVTMDIRGTLSNLAIIPSSTPSLRQDEIVAILINPGNVASVGIAGATSGATQGAITSGLASAGSGLITTLAFAPFQEQLRRTLGLDRVNVAVRTTSLGTTETEVTLGKSINLFGQRSALVLSHKKSGELNITSGQVEWRFGGLILQLGATKGGTSGLEPSGEVRHSWSPK